MNQAVSPAAQSCPDKPRRRGRARIVLRLEDWPGPDRRAWEHACTPTSLLDDGGQAAAWRPATRDAIAWSYSRWLTYLSRAGELVDLPDPAVRLTPERMQAFVVDLHDSGHGSVTLAGIVSHLAMAASALWPGRDWAWLRVLRARLQCRAVPSRRKVGRLVSPVALFDIGRQLMAEAEAMPERLRVTAARTYRDGLLIAFLALSLPRRKNLAAIERGQQLRREAERRTVLFTAEETKTHTVDTRLFPPALLPALERYLASFRPVFAARCQGGPSTAPWPGPDGRPLSAHAIWKLVTRHTLARLGTAVNPHLFRDAAATFLGDQEPENVRMAAALLGHADFRTTERHYILAQSRNAFRIHQEAVLAHGTALSRQGQDEEAREP